MHDDKMHHDEEKKFEKRIEKGIEEKFEKGAEDCGKKWHKDKGGFSGGIYCLGFIGAAVYYIGNADGFWAGVVGFLQALVWPAFLIYEAFTQLNG